MVKLTPEEKILVWLFQNAKPGTAISNQQCMQQLAISPKRYSVCCNMLAHGNYIIKHADETISLTAHGIRTCHLLLENHI